jgi:hypothetical protein
MSEVTFARLWRIGCAVLGYALICGAAYKLDGTGRIVAITFGYMFASLEGWMKGLYDERGGLGRIRQ